MWASRRDDSTQLSMKNTHEMADPSHNRYLTRAYYRLIPDCLFAGRRRVEAGYEWNEKSRKERLN